jgi:hypothetical protein
VRTDIWDAYEHGGIDFRVGTRAVWALDKLNWGHVGALDALLKKGFKHVAKNGCRCRPTNDCAAAGAMHKHFLGPPKPLCHMLRVASKLSWHIMLSVHIRIYCMAMALWARVFCLVLSMHTPHPPTCATFSLSPSTACRLVQ